MARQHRAHQEPATESVETPTADSSTETAATTVTTGRIPDVAGEPQGQTASERGFAAPGSGKPEIAATEQAMGKAMVSRMNEANGLDGGKYDLEHGIHYSYNFQSECERSGKPEMWKDEYRLGYNASGHFTQPFESGQYMEFQLKKGHSASKGIQAWLGGLTVAECYTTVKAMQLDTLRRAIGDTKFDQKFGAENKQHDAAIPDERRLRVSQEGSVADEYTKQTDLAVLAESNDGKVSEKELDTMLVPGQWYYFYNHPKYLLKHPGGAWQGENSLYMGKNAAGERTWAGLGASGMTEDGMTDEMVRAYNAPRDEEDERDMTERRIKRADGSYFVKKYDPKEGEFKDTVTKHEILNDGAYTIGGTSRKGGFKVDAGVTFDAKKVEHERK